MLFAVALRRRAIGLGGVVLAFLLGTAGHAALPGVGAGMLLHPARALPVPQAPEGCAAESFAGDGVTLAGWRCNGTGASTAGTIVYLHGVGDNRRSAVGIVQRFTRMGYDVVAYDSRAHGESGGDVCTYGFYEKRDLSKVIATIRRRPVVLIGTSLGAAVALQEAADDPRVAAIVGAETFSDLRTVATDRAPFFFSGASLASAFRLAAQQGRFDLDAVSPERAAARLTIPVLLFHGAGDEDTPPAHSERVFAALRGSKRLVIVPGATHSGSLTGESWSAIARWLAETVVPAQVRD